MDKSSTLPKAAECSKNVSSQGAPLQPRRSTLEFIRQFARAAGPATMAGVLVMN